MSETRVRIDSKDLDNFYEIHIDENGDAILYIIEQVTRSIQYISLGKIHPIELQNRAVDMMVLSREILKKES